MFHGYMFFTLHWINVIWGLDDTVLSSSQLITPHTRKTKISSVLYHIRSGIWNYIKMFLQEIFYEFENKDFVVYLGDWNIFKGSKENITHLATVLVSLVKFLGSIINNCRQVLDKLVQMCAGTTIWSTFCIRYFMYGTDLI